MFFHLFQMDHTSLGELDLCKWSCLLPLCLYLWIRACKSCPSLSWSSGIGSPISISSCLSFPFTPSSCSHLTEKETISTPPTNTYQHGSTFLYNEQTSFLIILTLITTQVTTSSSLWQYKAERMVKTNTHTLGRWCNINHSGGDKNRWDRLAAFCSELLETLRMTMPQRLLLLLPCVF